MTSVMLDGRYLGPSPSGVGRYCHEVVTAMQRQDPRIDWRFVVRHPGDQLPLAGDASAVFDTEPYGPGTSLRLGHKLGAYPADLFHSPFHVLPRGIKCKTVLTMHDDFNFNQNKMSNYPFPVSWVEWGYFLLAIPDSLRRATRIICVSRTTADLIGARVPAVKDKLRVVHHGVAQQFRPVATERVQATCRRLVGEQPFFLSIGAISPNKNHERMLTAFARAFPEQSGPKLVRISRFGDNEALARRARQLGVASRVVPLRTPSDDELLDLLNGALALVFCSIIEGFGLPVLEAMACGCPVLTSNRSCLPEVAGDAALLCDPFDVADMASQLKRLAESPSLRGELRDRGIARAATFSWERCARLHRDVYDEALAA